MDPKKTLSGEMGQDHEQIGSHGGRVPLVGSSPGAFVFSGRGPRIMLAPEDGSGAGGGTGGEGTGAAGEGGAEGAESGEGTGAVEKPVRPEYIPETLWDEEKGFKSDDLNAILAFKAEADSNAALVPEKPDGYQVSLPQDFKLPEGFELPEGQTAAIDETDPRVSAAREFAHNNKFSQSQFESLLALGVQSDFAEQSRLNDLLKEQSDMLGARGKERLSAVTTWIGAKLGGEHAKAIVPMLYTAKQVEAFEALMRLNRGAVPGSPGSGRDSGKTDISDEEYDKMSPAEKINYARQSSKK